MSFPISTDMYVKFDDVRRLDNNGRIVAITSATARLLLASDDSEVTGTSVSATQIGSTNSYEATIPNAGTANMTDGTSYKLDFALIESGSSWKRTKQVTDTASYA